MGIELRTKVCLEEYEREVRSRGRRETQGKVTSKVKFVGEKVGISSGGCRQLSVFCVDVQPSKSPLPARRQHYQASAQAVFYLFPCHRIGTS